jgi:mono/diheme cytochrome c family protein
MRNGTRGLRHGLLALAGALAAAGCAKPERREAPPGAAPHLGDDWFSFRAGGLGISVAAAASRDAALSSEHPPRPLDDACVLEADAIYRAACLACHGPEGKPPAKLPNGGAPPHEWGTTGASMGFFFGGDAMRAGLYRTIENGGETKDGVPSNMPAWKGTLSREQMWALVRELEAF